jgi:hypothetical protein
VERCGRVQLAHAGVRRRRLRWTAELRRQRDGHQQLRGEQRELLHEH